MELITRQSVDLESWEAAWLEWGLHWTKNDILQLISVARGLENMKPDTFTSPQAQDFKAAFELGYNKALECEGLQ